MKQNRLVVAVLASAAALTASAFGGVTGSALTIIGNVDGKTGSFEVPANWGTWENGNYGMPYQGVLGEIKTDSGEVLGTLTNVGFEYIADPVISLAFSITAGPAGGIFTFSSAVLSFGAFDAEARASASLTVTDNDGNGATAVGLYGVNKVYRANYNGAIPGPTQFTTLQNGLTSGAFDSVSGNEQFPGGGLYAPVGIIVDQQASYSFTLTGNDSASGTSVYVTREIPAPGALALLGLGGLVTGRRRR